MVHRAYIILGKIYWVIRMFFDYISDYVFGFFYHGKHEPLPPIKNPILLESAYNLAEKIRNRQLKSEEVVKAFIDRIREVNIIINAMVDQRFADAILEAQKADAVIASGEKSTEDLARDLPLLGVPYTTKECMSVKGLRQTGGLVSRKTFVADYNCPSVDRLARTGAILLGVCNTSELLLWLESNNKVYGRSKNCYDTTRTSGGSTGGDGTLLSACGTPLVLGTDIAGSIRVPSLFNGVFGHKPTPGCASVDGMIPPNAGEFAFYNTVGPMCRNAGDLCFMFKTMVDNEESALKLQLDRSVDLRNLRLFYQEDDGGNPFVTPVDGEIKNAIRKAIVHFEKMYGIKAVKLNLREFYYALEIFGSKMKTNAKESFSTNMANKKGEVNGVVEFMKWLIGCSDHSLPAIMLSMYEKIFNDDPAFVKDMDSKLLSLRNQLAEILGDNGVFLYPTYPKAALYHSQMIVQPLNFTYTCVFNVLGFPATHCPMGLNSLGLPIGFQIVSNMYNDRLNFAVAKEFERAYGGWVPPCPVQY
ncbi:hypothetical protein CHUAL_003040 [Chamberlinius hualienensis]